MTLLNWKKENMELKNMKQIKVEGQSRPCTSGGNYVMEVETKLTLEQKIAIMDEEYNGLASLLIYQLEKWEKEKHNVKKTKTGLKNKASERAMLKKVFDINMYKKLGIEKEIKFMLEREQPIYNLFNTTFKKFELTLGQTDYGYEQHYTGEHVAHQWFHQMLEMLKAEEIKYFKENDPREQLIKAIKHYQDRFGTMDSQKIMKLYFSGEDCFEDLDEMRFVVEKYKEIEKFTEKIKKQISEKLKED